MKRPKEKTVKELKANGGEWHTIKALEKYRYWDKNRQWDETPFRKAGLQLVSFTAKCSNRVDAGKDMKFTRAKPLMLKNGFMIDQGCYTVNAQSESVCLTNVRVDGVDEMNDVMLLVSDIYPEMSMWEIRNVSLYNKKTGEISHWKFFNPDTTGCELYFHALETIDSFRFYYDIPLMEQQRAAGHIQERVAWCKVVNEPNVKCGYEQYMAQGKSSN